MRHYKTARAILRNSLEDIKAGLWCTGELAIHGTCKAYEGALPYQIGEGFLSTKHAQRELDNSFEVDLPKKPMGCAIGLLSMYGGLGTDVTLEVDGADRTFFEPQYPDSKNITPGVLTSMRALVNSIPRKRRSDSFESLEEARDEKNFVAELEIMVDAIVAYNDHLDRADARKWFKSALDKTPKS